MTAWLRRLFRRPPTIADCMRAASTHRPTTVRTLSAEDRRRIVAEYRQAIVDAPCEPLNAPVDWVERTRQSHNEHQARYRNDDGWVEPVWGTFADQHDLGGEA